MVTRTRAVAELSLKLLYLTGSDSRGFKAFAAKGQERLLITYFTRVFLLACVCVLYSSYFDCGGASDVWSLLLTRCGCVFGLVSLFVVVRLQLCQMARSETGVEVGNDGYKAVVSLRLSSCPNVWQEIDDERCILSNEDEVH